MAGLPENWKNWVLESLLQGSDSVEILKILLQNGFTFESAKKVLGANLPAGVQCNKDGAFYARVANPTLLSQLDQYAAQVIDLPDIQLIKIDNFLDQNECDALVRLSKQHLRPSELPVRDEDHYKGFRTSSTCDLPFTQDPLAFEIDTKIVKALGLGVGEREVIQAQHYGVGQQFKAHYDYFAPGSTDFKVYQKQGGQRTWTFMIYLNEACEGGETEFVKLGLKFKPKTGTALVWNNLHADGEVNENTLHQAHPITSGEKIVITKWFREDTYEPAAASMVAKDQLS
jgi:prolyl 4-hydroxylase